MRLYSSLCCVLKTYLILKSRKRGRKLIGNDSGRGVLLESSEHLANMSKSSDSFDPKEQSVNCLSSKCRVGVCLNNVHLL